MILFCVCKIADADILFVSTCCALQNLIVFIIQINIYKQGKIHKLIQTTRLSNPLSRIFNKLRTKIKFFTRYHINYSITLYKTFGDAQK